MSEFEDFNSLIQRFGSKSDFIEFMYMNSPNFVLINDLQGNFVYANKLDFIGYTNEELKQEKNLFNLVHPDDRRLMEQYLSKILQVGTLSNVEYRFLHKKGYYVYLNTNATLIKDKKGENIGVLTSTHDITDKKEAEEKLVKSQKFYKSLFANMIDGFAYHRIVLNKNGKPIDYLFLDINEAFSKITGLTKDILGKPVTEVIPGIENDPADWIGRYGEIALNPNKSIIFESEALPLKKTFLVHAYSPEKGYFVAIFTDITEKKKGEEDRLNLLKLESLSLLAGGIAHDYNNLLTSILGNVNLIQMDNNIDIINPHLLNSIEKATHRAKDLTNQLLTFSKGGEPIIKSVSIKKVVEEAVSLSLIGSKSKAIIECRDKFCKVMGDEGQLNQVLSNILINADQSMDKGGIIKIVISSVSIPPEEIAELEVGTFIKITIQDTGKGIPKEIMPHIFDPYFTTKPTGTGLGLATAYSIIKRHKGCIKIQTEKNIGSTFDIYLPLSDEIHSIKEEKPFDEENFRGKILFMDDNEEIQLMMTKMLALMGFEVDVVSDGIDAITNYCNAFKNNDPYQLVILDLTIPGGLGGKETIKKILENDPDCKAIVASGYSNDPILSDYESYGFKGRILKPFTIQQLKKSISDVLFSKN